MLRRRNPSRLNALRRTSRRRKHSRGRWRSERASRHPGAPRRGGSASRGRRRGELASRCSHGVFRKELIAPSKLLALFPEGGRMLLPFGGLYHRLALDATRNPVSRGPGPRLGRLSCQVGEAGLPPVGQPHPTRSLPPPGHIRRPPHCPQLRCGPVCIVR